MNKILLAIFSSSLLAMNTFTFSVQMSHSVDSFNPYIDQYVADQGKLLDYPTQLKPIIDKIHRVPEVRQLLTRIQEKGPIKIKVNRDLPQTFNAFWEGNTRTIFVTLNPSRNEGEIIHSILFELHNALTDPQFEQLVNLAIAGKIDKEAYVEKVEKMEYNNALDTIKIVNQGIRQGTFPFSAKRDLRQGFDDHYKIQQLSGHSIWIAEQFDQYCPQEYKTQFQGTIPNLNRMSARERDRMIDQIYQKQA